MKELLLQATDCSKYDQYEQVRRVINSIKEGNRIIDDNDANALIEYVHKLETSMFYLNYLAHKERLVFKESL